MFYRKICLEKSLNTHTQTTKQKILKNSVKINFTSKRGTCMYEVNYKSSYTIKEK